MRPNYRAAFPRGPPEGRVGQSKPHQNKGGIFGVRRLAAAFNLPASSGIARRSGFPNPLRHYLPTAPLLRPQVSIFPDPIVARASRPWGGFMAETAMLRSTPLRHGFPTAPLVRPKVSRLSRTFSAVRMWARVPGAAPRADTRLSPGWYVAAPLALRKSVIVELR